jgi:hypothetical protein
MYENNSSTSQLELQSIIDLASNDSWSCRHKMLSKSALVVAASVAVVEAIDNGLARTPQMGWVSYSLHLCEK